MFIQIAYIIVYFNTVKKNNSEIQLSDDIRLFLSSMLTSCLSTSELSKGIRLSFFSQNKEELGIIVFLECFGIYNTISNFKLSLKTITVLLNRYKNTVMQDVKSDYPCVIAIKSHSTIEMDRLISFLEEQYSKIYESQIDKNYEKNIDIEDLTNSTSEALKKNAYFLKCRRTTKFHDIDIKLWEVQKVIAVNCSITAIVMLGVILEECCKTVLKNDLERELTNLNNPSIKSLANASLEAEKKYGSLSLGKLIVALFKKNYIDKEEYERLLNIKKYIRNAFIHSDKSKLFDDKKGRVKILKLLDSNRIHISEEQLSPLEMSFVLGLMQKQMADKNVKIFFYEIEEYIHRITQRFWDRSKV